MSHAAAHPWPGKRKMILMARSRKGGRGRHSHRGGYPLGRGEWLRGGPRVSRGDVRIAILLLLGEQPMHGYQIIQELTERTDGMWQPSPGSVYPTLQQLEDEGLVTSEQLDGKNVFSLTEAGRTAAGDATPPWERLVPDAERDLLGLKEAGLAVGAAVMQVARAGTDDQVDRATAVLDEARKQLYRILAEDDATSIE